jgi:hypothetical protein
MVAARLVLANRRTTIELDSTEAMHGQGGAREVVQLPGARAPSTRRGRHNGNEKAIAVKRSRVFAMKLEDREG